MTGLMQMKICCNGQMLLDYDNYTRCAAQCCTNRTLLAMGADLHLHHQRGSVTLMMRSNSQWSRAHV